MPPDNGKRKKIVLVAGARPNFMKVAPLYRELRRRSEFHPVLVHTGQHYDWHLSGTVWADLRLPKPHVFLGIGSGSHAHQTAQVMLKFEKTCLDERPSMVVVVGDVNSTMACAITAKKLNIPVAHVEAGLRSWDMSMPEEINRLVTDRISDVLLTPSRDANENLLREGARKDAIHFVGNIMIDSLRKALPLAKRSRCPVRLGLQAGSFGLITLHRPSNVDDTEHLAKLIGLLNRVSRRLPLVFPVHPRTRKNLERIRGLEVSPALKLIEPAGYIDFLSLELRAKFVLTDSGGIQEETTYLGIPCLTLRENTERPVTITEGTNELVGMQTAEKKISRILAGKWKAGRTPRYWDGRTAGRIVSVIRSALDQSLS